MRSNSNLIYIVECIDSAFSSQVVEVLEEIARSSFFDTIHLVVGLERGKELPIVAEGVIVHGYSRSPALPVIGLSGSYEIARLLKDIAPPSNTVIHCRGEAAAYLANWACKIYGRKMKLLLDVRGAIRPEILGMVRSNPFKLILKRLLLSGYRRAYRESDAVSYVTSYLKDYCDSEYGDFKIKNKAIIPCCAGRNFRYSEIERRRVRSELGVADGELLCLFASGGDAHWQNTDAAVQLAKNLACKLLLLTKKEYHSLNVISRFVPYKDMPKYLSAADVGVMLREHSVINFVASPIKISEYWCSGLPVITTDAVASVCDVIRQDGFGRIVDSLNEITSDLLSGVLENSRDDISERYEKRFGVKAVASHYLNLYESMIAES